jgi:hypothetical protein
MQQTLPGTVPPTPAVQPAPVTSADPLQLAIETIQTALNGGKVTRKVLEGVLPLLQKAQSTPALITVTATTGEQAPPLFGLADVMAKLKQLEAAIERVAPGGR